MTTPAAAPASSGFDSFFEFLPIGAYRSSQSGVHFRANPALVRLNGYDTEAQLLAAVRDIANECYVDPQRRAEFAAALLRDGQVRGFVSEVFRHRTRERIWVSENAHLVRDADGQPLFFEGTVEDLSERIDQLAELERREAQLRQLADHVPGMVYRVHFVNGKLKRYSFVSQGVREVYGLSAAEVMANPAVMRPMRHPDDHARLDGVVAEATRLGLPLAVEFRIVTTDGKVRSLQMNSSVVEQTGDEQVRVGVIIDVTAQREVEQALRDSDVRWKLALDSVGDGVWDWNPLTRHASLSPRCRELYGLPPDHDGELDFLMHPDDREAALAARQAHLEGRTPVYVSEHRMRHADGRWKWILSRGMVIERDEQGRPARMIGTHTDVTERREADALRAQRDRAEAAQRAMTQFLSRVSHELRTPLNAILGFTQLVVTDPGTSPKHRPWLEEVLGSGRHLLGLVDDILDLTGAQSGLMSFELEAVPLAPVLQECRSMLAAAADSMQLLVSETIVGQDLKVRADRKRLKQVLSNLLSNAIKYNRRGGSIFITCRREGDAVELAVEDTGHGLDEVQLARLFAPFDRLGAQRSAIPGTGLGLSLSRQLVEGMGGRIVVSSRPGEGSRFSLRLPPA